MQLYSCFQSVYGSPTTMVAETLSESRATQRPLPCPTRVYCVRTLLRFQFFPAPRSPCMHVCSNAYNSGSCTLAPTQPLCACLLFPSCVLAPPPLLVKGCCLHFSGSIPLAVSIALHCAHLSSRSLSIWRRLPPMRPPFSLTPILS